VFLKPWKKARASVGRSDLRFHDLRHTGAALAAQEGATLPELQARLGHTTPAAAMVYQHAASERDKLLAERLSRRAMVAARQS
jgi:integrase